MSARLWFPLPSYRPVVGGYKHRTRLHRKPRAGTVVQLLCGASYIVARERRKPPISVCQGCEAAHQGAE
ncbi:MULTISPECIES: DUF3039 domain-containing protein [Amycolatopsis]|uniref:DUF3039 domain-containing protein n=1 Tax=Amycolatopsis TaxID=1813 RepID=UPI00041C8BC0|nr:DUF3039 domain-containing protein [Amycolatopsis thermoflava]